MEQEKQNSEFNDAIGTIGRMNSLFYVAVDAAMKLDAHQWYHSLRALKRELKTDMKEEKNKELNDTIKKIDELLPIYLNNAKRGLSEISTELYDLLDLLETELREIHDKAGYKTKRSDDPRFSL